MKTKIVVFAFLSLLLQVSCATAQNVTTVNARNSDISDNLDLRAVASIFGEASNLEDFERRLNNPRLQISNLDLNNDGRVDYLRVIESVEDRMHLIIIQAVLEVDIFQDVATIEVERDNNNQVQVQVVGDVYMYGQNYIYEPVYVTRPVIYTTFWVGSYRPYYSPWNWNYYPTHFYAWNPYPIYRYRRNVNLCINVNHTYNYVNVRRSERAVAIYNTRRSNGYERMYPNRSFTQRNNVTNRYELDRTRNVASNGRRSENGDRNRIYTNRSENNTRSGNYLGRNGNTTRVSRNENATSNGRINSTRNETSTRATTRNERATAPRTENATRVNTQRTETSTRGTIQRSSTPSERVTRPENIQSNPEPRNTRVVERSESRNTTSPARVQSAPQRSESTRSNSNQGGSRREASGSTRGNSRN